MTEAARLVGTIKARLRAQGLTYRDVAAALGLSEISVKRLFKSGRFTVDRLARVAEILGFTLAELAQEAQAAGPRLRTLTEAQERELVSDIKLLLVAVCALNQWSLADMVTTYRLTEAQCLKRLLRLDRLGLIDLLPGNRIRVKVARDFDWLPNGPIKQYFRSLGQGDFLDSAFSGTGEDMAFIHGMLTDSAVAELQAELRRLRRKFAQLHDEGLAAPLEKKRGTGLLVAVRGWEPAGFAELRRPAAE